MGRQTKLEDIKPTSVNYRKEDDYLSYSKLSTFAKDKVKYYKRYILKEEEDEDDEVKELRFGTMVDLFLTDEEDFDRQFIVLEEVPAPQVKKFCNLIYKKSKTGALMSDAAQAAYEDLKEKNGGKIRSGLVKMLEEFDTPVAKDYYNTLVEGKCIIDAESRSKAFNIANKCKYAKQFRANCDSSEIYRKFKLTFQFNGRNFGCEIDEFEICHDEKKIYLYDYKTASFIDGFVFQGYLKFNYYIQASLYRYGLIEWAKEHYPGYEVDNMSFKVMDSSNYLDPLLFKTTNKHYENGFSGFYVGSRHYKGIVQLIEELEMSEETGTWRMSIENYNNGGVVHIPEFKNMLDREYE